MQAIWSYRGNRPTNKQTHTHKHTNTDANPQTGPITIHCAAKLTYTHKTLLKMMTKRITVYNKYTCYDAITTNDNVMCHE